MDVAELSVTAELIERTESKEAQLAEAAEASTLSQVPRFQVPTHAAVAYCAAPVSAHVHARSVQAWLMVSKSTQLTNL